MRGVNADLNLHTAKNYWNPSIFQLALAMLLEERGASQQASMGQELWAMRVESTILLLAVVLALSLPVVGPQLPVLGPWINYYLLTKRVVPIKKIETLTNAVAVTGWS